MWVRGGDTGFIYIYVNIFVYYVTFTLLAGDIYLLCTTFHYILVIISPHLLNDFVVQTSSINVLPFAKDQGCYWYVACSGIAQIIVMCYYVMFSFQLPVTKVYNSQDFKELVSVSRFHDHHSRRCVFYSF